MKNRAELIPFCRASALPEENPLTEKPADPAPNKSTTILMITGKHRRIDHAKSPITVSGRILLFQGASGAGASPTGKPR